jgi:hypothetical protein
VFSPWSGAKALMYTSALMSGSVVPALVMTAPPYEWPTRTTGPVVRWWMKVDR